MFLVNSLVIKKLVLTVFQNYIAGLIYVSY